MLEYPKTKIMKILSLFDGVSCARLALEKAGIPVEAYYASEIDKYAIKVTQANRPDTIQMGSVLDVKYDREWKHIECLKGFSKKVKIELLIGGSPCQGLSIAKKDRKGLDGDRSSLFYEYVRILNEVKPKYFILENVASMPQKDKDIISQTLGVQPVMINASLVSGQNRKRLFWVGRRTDNDNYEQVHVPQPEDKHIYLKDILEDDYENVQACSLRGRYIIEGRRKDVKGAKTTQRLELGGDKSNSLTSVQKDSLIFIGGIGKKDWVGDGKYFSRNYPQGNRVYSPDGKSPTLSALGGGLGAKTGLYEIDGDIRKLTPIECERLQCMPDGWTNPTGDISNTQRYKMCGNAFNVDVVAHIIKHLK